MHGIIVADKQARGSRAVGRAKAGWPAWHDGARGYAGGVQSSVGIVFSHQKSFRPNNIRTVTWRHGMCEASRAPDMDASSHLCPEPRSHCCPTGSAVLFLHVAEALSDKR